MNDASMVWEVLTGSFTELIKFIKMWVQITIDSRISPSIVTMIGYFIVISFFLGSAFISATISEMKGKSKLIHFVLGLFIPYAYPVAILFLLPGFKQQKNENEDLIAVQEENRAGISMEKYGYEPEDLEPEDDAEENNGEEPPLAREVGAPELLDQSYFVSISVDDEGNSQGPFMIELADGRMLQANNIVNAMPEVVALDIISEKGSQTIRLPYNKIVSCNPV